MTKQQKFELVSTAYESIKKGEEDIYILSEKLQGEERDVIMNIQIDLDAGFELSYEIMAEACGIISDKTLTGEGRDSLTGDDLDFYADADSRANVYTAVQLSYLTANNEGEISDLMQDESITSIAQACSAWYTAKVVEACEALKDYILAD